MNATRSKINGVGSTQIPKPDFSEVPFPQNKPKCRKLSIHSQRNDGAGRIQQDFNKQSRILAPLPGMNMQNREKNPSEGSLSHQHLRRSIANKLRQNQNHQMSWGQRKMHSFSVPVMSDEQLSYGPLGHKCSLTVAPVWHSWQGRDPVPHADVLSTRMGWSCLGLLQCLRCGSPAHHVPQHQSRTRHGPIVFAGKETEMSRKQWITCLIQILQWAQAFSQCPRSLLWWADAKFLLW